MIKGVIFDLDGTLVSEREYIYGCFRETAAVIEQKYEINNAYEKLIDLFHAAWYNVFGRLLEAEQIKYSPQDIRILVETYRNADPVIKIYDDVEESLSMLRERGIIIVVLTNGFEATQRKKIEKSGITRWVDEIMIPDQFGKEFWKPDTRCCHKILQKWSLLSRNVTFVGDSISDYETARNLEVKMIYVDRPDTVNQFHYKNYVTCIQNLNQLIGILEL